MYTASFLKKETKEKKEEGSSGDHLERKPAHVQRLSMRKKNKPGINLVGRGGWMEICN